MSAANVLRDDEVLELGEMLEFLADWIDSAPDTLGQSLTDFIGGGYTLDELRAEVSRFVFLLGGTCDRIINGNQP